jgi:hypothetical protein
MGFAVNPNILQVQQKQTGTPSTLRRYNRLMSRSNTNPDKAQYQLSPFAKSFLYLAAFALTRQ